MGMETKVVRIISAIVAALWILMLVEFLVVGHINDFVVVYAMVFVGIKHTADALFYGKTPRN